MEVLVHYTTQEIVYDAFNNEKYKVENTSHRERFKAIDKYYKKYYLSQDNLFFIVRYYEIETSNINFSVGKIFKLDDISYDFIKVSDEIKNNIIINLGLDSSNTYDNGIYYKEYYVDSNESFYCRKLNSNSNKIRLKYFSWEELILDKLPLHRKLIDILFDRDNVLNIASTYCPSRIDLKRKEELLNRKYISSLRKIGFLSDNEIDIENTVLQGDIGEFLMDIMIGKYFESDDENTYVYPKLAIKSNPNMAVYGNDGTFYNIQKNEIYFCESKFDYELKKGLSNAIDSLKAHEKADYDFIESNIDLFRNISNNKIGEIIEITEDVKEKLIIFLTCSDIYTAEDVENVINGSRKLKALKGLNEILVFVLPVLSKEDFLILFKKFSEQKRSGMLP